MKIKSIPSWQIYIIGFSSIILSLLLILFVLYLNKSSKEKDNDVSLHSNKEYIEYLEKYSTIFDDKNNFSIVTPNWPTENITINTNSKCIFFTKGNDTIKVEYKKVKGKNACITLEHKSEEETINNYLENLSLPIDSVFEIEIKSCNQLTETERKLSRLYNVLVGNPSGHIILGKDEEEWKLYQTDDFPQYKIDEEKLREFVDYHRNNPKCDVNECYSKFPFIVKNVDLYCVYYALRQDTVIERDNKKVSTSASLQHDLTKLKCYQGWLNYRTTTRTETKWHLVSAYEYYIRSGYSFLKTPQDIDNFIKITTWKEPNAPCKLLMVLLYVFSSLFLIIGILLLGWYAVRKYQANTKKTKCSQDLFTDEKTISGDSSSAQYIAQLEQKIAEFDSTLEKIKENAIEEYKKDNDIENKIKYANNWTILIKSTSAKKVYQILDEIRKKYDSFPELETAESVQIAQEQAIANYKKQYDIENQLIRAKNWKALVACTTSKALCSFLENVKKTHASFPDLYTIETACKESITAAPNNDKQQIACLLQYISKHVDTKYRWYTTFTEICEAATYANDVRPQFEEVKTIIQNLIERSELKKIMGKDNLNYWDRLALSHMAIAELNHLLQTFKSSHLKASTLQTAQSALISDLLQQYLSRIFVGNLAENKTFIQYQTGVETVLNQKLADLNTDYAIQFALDDAFNNARKAFEKAYSNIIGTKEFVQLMEEIYVNQFEEKVETNLDRGWFFSMIVAMGYHMVDFVHRYQGLPDMMCPNYRYLMSGLDSSTLPEDAKFTHNDYAYSSEYTNRIFEWLDDLGVKHLKALIGRQLIKP